MKILLIGADGTLGTSLQETLKSSHEVISWTFSNLDLTQLAGIAAKVIEQKPEVIVNAAAFTNVDGAEENEALATTINGDAVGELAKASQQIGSTLVHISTDYVFDGTKKEGGYTEHDPPNPINAYGRSKLWGEVLLKQYTNKYILVRTSRLFGVSQLTAAHKQSFIDKMIELSRTRPVLQVVNDETTSPTYADDLASSMSDLLEKKMTGLFHRTNDGACTWYEFAQQIFSMVPYGGTLEPVPGSRFPRPAQRPTRSALISTKLPPLRYWQQALAEYLSKKGYTS